MLSHRFAIALAALILPTVPALAFDPVLTAADIEEAQAEAAQLAGDHTHGYVVADWVLVGADDPIELTPNEGLVEAVIVGTPFERLRYAAYLADWTGQPLTADAANAQAAAMSGTISFIVYAHSGTADPADQNFLDRFAGGQIVLDSGQTIPVTSTDVFGPALDFYVVQGTGNEFRWLGFKEFVFSLASLDLAAPDLASAKGTFSFTDSAGQPHSYPFDLSTYR